jgi:TolB-like protein
MTPATPSRRHLLLMLAAGAGLGGCAQMATNLGLAPLLQRLGLMDAPAPALPATEAAALRALDVQGGRALLAGDVEGAITAWGRYAQQAPSTLQRARQLRGHLTLLRREAARRFVQRATAAEAATGQRRTDRLHVAVLPFANAVPSPSSNVLPSASSSPAAPAAPAPAPGFNRAIVAMIAVDLARVPGLTVLEREKVELLTAELRLSASALVDPATAARPGRLLGAGTVVGGEVLNAPGPTGPGSGRYRLSTAVGDVTRGRLLGQAEIEGLQSEFFVLQKRIVHGILDLLEVPNRPAAVDVVHTRSWEAYARFARGLQLLSEDKFTEAREAFVAALGFDPAFAMAEEAFLSTPERPATLQEMAAAAASSR